jgi:hypothetical protein
MSSFSEFHIFVRFGPQIKISTDDLIVRGLCFSTETENDVYRLFIFEMKNQ